MVPIAFSGLYRVMAFRETYPAASGLATGEMVLTRDEAFEAFVAAHEPGLRRALVAAYGAGAGREATADALAYAWEHWDRVAACDNPAGYVYRVGQSQARRRRRRPLFGAADGHSDPLVEPKLRRALLALSPRQRVCVVLVHGYGWTLREVAELTGTKATTVQNHLERGMRRLRAALGADEGSDSRSADHATPAPTQEGTEQSRSTPS